MISKNVFIGIENQEPHEILRRTITNNTYALAWYELNSLPEFGSEFDFDSVSVYGLIDFATSEERRTDKKIALNTCKTNKNSYFRDDLKICFHLKFQNFHIEKIRKEVRSRKEED